MTDDSKMLTRRALIHRTTTALGVLGAASLLCRNAPAAAFSRDEGTPRATGDHPLQIGMLLFPGFTTLDLVGPHLAFFVAGVSHVAAKTRDLVVSDSGLAIAPTTTFADCPKDLDVLFVPGGGGTADAMEDDETLRFLTDRAPTSRYVTSVCTGAFVLAAAGLLQGYRATTHWLGLDALAEFDVEVVRERVVIDRNRMTGGGVTAGIDFGLALLAQARNETVAKTSQLLMEYAPSPPFGAGSPEGAGPEVTAIARDIMKEPNARLTSAASAAARRLRAHGSATPLVR